MSEPQQLRESLARALAEEPPLSFDPDALISRAQREARRRRTLAAVGAATVVALVALAIPAALGLFRDHGQVTAATSAPLLTTAAGTPPSSPAPSTRAFYTAAELNATAGRFTEAVIALMPKVVPGVGKFGLQDWTNLSKSLPLDSKTAVGTGELGTYVTFTLKGISTGISIVVDAPYVSALPTAQAACPQWRPANGISCTIAAASADGGTLVIERSPAGQKLQLVRVIDYRPDGSVVSATAYNYDPMAKTPIVFAGTPFVSSDDLTILATSPSLAFG